MRYPITLLCWFLSLLSHAQEGTSQSKSKNGKIITETDPSSNPEEVSQRENTGELITVWTPSPTKAALYSTILPGLGQGYNKKYWKTPIVWGLLAGGLYSFAYNQKQYQKWNDLYVDAVNGIPNPNNYCTEQLAGIRVQGKRNYSYAILFAATIYVLNILDALVDAHLSEIDHDKDLSVGPRHRPRNHYKSTPPGGLSLYVKL